jgi:hypothetical protein
MNIFYLDEQPHLAAQFLCDKHIPKMVLETAQMLCTAQHVNGCSHEALYKAAYVKHPSTVWVGSSLYAYEWTYMLFLDLLHEYSHRFDRTHACDRLREHLGNFPSCHKGERSVPPQCMPDIYKGIDTVSAYRRYYVGEKMYFAKWVRGTAAPYWLNDRQYRAPSPEKKTLHEIERLLGLWNGETA